MAPSSSSLVVGMDGAVLCVAASGMLRAGLGSDQTAAPERIGELAVLADLLRPEVASLDQHRRQCLGEWHLVRHELRDALEVVAQRRQRPPPR
jgi:hypothetical protein